MPATVRDAMTRDPVTLASTASAVEAARKMREFDIGGLVVTDKQGICGFVTDRDLVIRALANGDVAAQLGTICSRQLVTVSPDDPVNQVVKHMRDNAIRRVVVTADGKLEGIVSIGDLAVKSNEKSALADISSATPNN